MQTIHSCVDNMDVTPTAHTCTNIIVLPKLRETDETQLQFQPKKDRLATTKKLYKISIENQLKQKIPKNLFNVR